MVTMVLPRDAPAPQPAPPRYERGWTAVALLAGAVLAAAAIVQSTLVPLLFLVAGLAAFGGTLFVRASWTTARARHEYAVGALAIAGCVLVAVGIGHHVTAGLATVGLLFAAAPWTIRWIAGDSAQH